MKRWTGKRLQGGQSMAEYVVILMALTAALLWPWDGTEEGRPVGLMQNDPGSLLQAVANKHRGHVYALSLPEIPETDDLVDLADYYDSLGKYPELSPQVRQGGQLLDDIKRVVGLMADLIKEIRKIFKPPQPKPLPPSPL